MHTKSIFQCLSLRRIAGSLGVLYLVLTQSSAIADNSLLESNIKKNMEVAHTIQLSEEEWNSQRVKMESLIEKLQEKKELLIKTVDALDWENERLQKRVIKISSDINKAKQLTEGLDPIIKNQTKIAHNTVSSGLPFLYQERSMRLHSLDDWLKAPTSEQAEKLERLLEFFTIETQFGHTSESWQSAIELNGKKRIVELLKIGRIALFYQTLDKKECGVYRPSTESYIELDQGCSQLKNAVALANRERSAELVTLPIGKVTLP